MKDMSTKEFEETLNTLENLLDEEQFDIDSGTAEAVKAAIDFMQENAPRTVKNYRITHCVHIGSKEVAFAIDEDPENKEPYLVCDVEILGNIGLTVFTECMGSANYLEMMRLFTQRVNRQIESVVKENSSIEGCNEVFGAAQVVPQSSYGEYEGKIMLVRANILRHEYRTAAHQIVLAEGGNGCSPTSHGRTVYCKNLATGKQESFIRTDFLGEVKAECLPTWAKEKLAAQSKEKKAKDREER